MRIGCDFISLEAFATNDFNEIFSGRQPRQDVKFSDVLWADCLPIFRLGRTKTLKKGTQSVPEMSENLHILTRLSA
jgi:hypothetical protein